jgi:hypothetical protein
MVDESYFLIAYQALWGLQTLQGALWTTTGPRSTFNFLTDAAAMYSAVKKSPTPSTPTHLFLFDYSLLIGQIRM